MLTVKDKLEAGPMFDHAIVEHRFTPYMRDYDIVVEVTAAVPDGSRSYVASRYLYRFTHCVMAQITTSLSDDTWRDSWNDEFIDYSNWENAGAPSGYVWGVCWSLAYPGLSYVDHSELAREWSRRLGKTMHEVKIDTNSQNFGLVFHDVVIKQIAIGDPNTDQLKPV
jgi:hypothetical protein